MSNEKPTIGEQADRQAQALVESGISRIEKPQPGLGSKYCHECGETIPMARREAYNCKLCIDCKTRQEVKRR